MAISIATEGNSVRLTPLVRGERATKWRGDSIERITQSFSDLSVRKIQPPLTKGLNHPLNIRRAKNLPLTGKACERRLRRIQRTRLGAAVEKREEKCKAPDAFFGHRKRAKVARRSRDGRREFL